MISCASVRSWLVAALMALLTAAPPPAQSAAVPSRELTPAQLVAQLRQGGLTLFLRHTATDFSENDSRMKNDRDCGGQRNLVDKGRDDARKIGIAIRALRIPVGRVVSSPFCRTIETAELAFGRAEIATEVRYAKPGEQGAARYAPLREMLETRPERANTIIVGHGTPFYTLTQVRLAEGEIAVLRPLGTGFEIMGRIKPDDWSALRAGAGR
jgi:broad specificity phosphatase PhoE